MFILCLLPILQSAVLPDFKISQISPTIGIYIQSSVNTRLRLRDMFRAWDLFTPYNAHYELFEVVGETIPKHLQVYCEILNFQICGAKRDQSPCRYHQSMIDFVTNPNRSHLNWMMYSDDDTLIRADSVYKYTQELESFLNPREHVVLKAHANREMRNILFVHGGSGWLMSRALCEFMINTGESLDKYLPLSRYFQPDTTMGIIARRMFKPHEWDEMGFVGDLDRLPGDSHAPPCPNNETIPFNKLLTLHSRGINPHLLNSFISSFNSPDNLHIYRIPERQTSKICSGKGMPYVPLVSRTPIKTKADFPVPLYKPGELAHENSISWISPLPDTYNEDGFNHSIDPDKFYRRNVRT